MSAPASFDLAPLVPILCVGGFVIILAAILAAVRNGTGIWNDLRRKPSASEVFASKTELKSAEERSIQRWKDSQAAYTSLELQHKQQLADLERRLTADISTNRAQAESHFGEIRAMVVALSNSVSGLSGDMNRAIGRLEGASAALHSAAVKVSHANATT